MERQQVTAIILGALAYINEGRAPGQRIEVNTDTRLFGQKSWLDSLELVNLLLEVEGRLGQQFGLPIYLMDERALSRERSPFRSVNTLADYVMELVNGGLN